MRYKQFYAELGKMLYAVADIDGKIAPAEKRKLRELVKKELVPAENHLDEFGTDAAYFTEIEFDYLEESISDPADAFESFLQYMEDHQTALDHHLISVTRKVSAALAEAYHHTSKREKALLVRLNNKLDELERKIRK